MRLSQTITRAVLSIFALRYSQLVNRNIDCAFYCELNEELSFMKILLFLIAIHVSIYDRDLYMSLRLFKTLMGHLPTSITLE